MIDHIFEEYYDWICSIAISNNELRQAYSKLLRGLWDTPFVYSLSLDKNREIDGLSLRYKFGIDFSYPYDAVRTLDMRPCSVLEMMVALAYRCETQIMQNQTGDDRTSFWFMEMVTNLRLATMTDENFDPEYFEKCMNTLLTRSYTPNGYGGLFVVENPREDMRETDIWYQCMWYLEEYLQRRS